MKKYRLPIVLTIALIAAIGWGAYEYNQKDDYHTYLDIHFQRQFYELIGHVENAQVNLTKAMVCGSNRDMVKFLNDTRSQSYMAQEKLTGLPFHHGAIRGTEGFLSQLGDYSTAMVNKSLEGISLSSDELNTMLELHGYANELSQELIELQKDVVAGGVNFGDLRREGNKSLNEVEDRMKDFGLINFEERMQDYPELIYDGPFSDHLKNVKAKVQGKNIDEDEAVDVIVSAFKKSNLRDIKVTDTIRNQAIDGYYISGVKSNSQGENEIYAAVSRAGGNIMWYIDPTRPEENLIGKEEAIIKAEEFLQGIGLKNMESTYSIAYEGQMVINFAYEEDNVLMYSDLVKVKVALDNGEIIGFESEGYLTNHHKRNINKPKLSEDDARENLSSLVEEEEVRLAVIPIAGEKEVLTYEFKVKFGKDNYLVYIDANTGDQRKLLLMIEEEDGTLVI